MSRKLARRSITLAAAGLSAAALTLAPAAAQAAPGELIINDQPIENPSGCYPVPDGAVVSNHTPVRAMVHVGDDCGEALDGMLPPGAEGQMVIPGHSISIS